MPYSDAFLIISDMLPTLVFSKICAQTSRTLTIQLKGQNLATFTGLEYIDPEATTSGLSVYPLFRTFTAGLKLNF